jgi:hypothetical protein
MSGPTPDPRDDRRIVTRLPADLADAVAREITAATSDEAEVRVSDALDQRDALIAEQQAEVGGVVQGPPVSTAPISGPQARGAIAGTITFGAVGLVVGLLIGLIPMFDLPLGARMGLWALVCTMGAAASGFVFGGGREPELEGALRDTSGDVTVSLTSDSADDRARALRIMQDADLEVARRARDLARRDHPQQPSSPADERPRTAPERG